MLKNSFYAKKPLSIFIASVVFIFSFVWMSGCQKNKQLTEEKSEAQKTEEVLKWISEQKTTSFFVPGGKIIDSYRTDLAGNRVNFSRATQEDILAAGPGCYVDEPSPAFEGINYSEVCDSDPRMFNATVSFKISSDNAIVARNPNQPNSTATANQTRGRLQVTNSDGSQVLFNQANIYSTIVITDLGVDPLVASNRIYRVTYNVNNIPETALNTANYVARAYITFYTECEEQSSYAYNLIGAYGSATGLSACDIINKVWINPSFPSISGVAACLCCVPPLYSNRHDVEIYSNNSIIPTTDGVLGTTVGLLWKKRITAIQTVYIPTTSGANIGDGWVAPNQTVKIRYKNVQLNGSNIVQCTSQWLIVPETWVF